MEKKEKGREVKKSITLCKPCLDETHVVSNQSSGVPSSSLLSSFLQRQRSVVIVCVTPSGRVQPLHDDKRPPFSFDVETNCCDKVEEFVRSFYLYVVGLKENKEKEQCGKYNVPSTIS
jgi:hypothetical protein